MRGKGSENWWSSDLWFVNCPRLPLTSCTHRRLQVHRKLMIVWGKWGKPSSHQKRLVFWKLKKKGNLRREFCIFWLGLLPGKFPSVGVPRCCRLGQDLNMFFNPCLFGEMSISLLFQTRPEHMFFITLVCSARCLYHFRIGIWFASWDKTWTCFL